MIKLETITWDEWDEKYQPIYDEDESLLDFWCDQTPEQKVIWDLAQKEDRVWTLLDGDDWSVASGQHYVNRLAYYVTKVKPMQAVEVLEEFEMN